MKALQSQTLSSCQPTSKGSKGNPPKMPTGDNRLPSAKGPGMQQAGSKGHQPSRPMLLQGEHRLGGSNRQGNLGDLPRATRTGGTKGLLLAGRTKLATRRMLSSRGGTTRVLSQQPEILSNSNRTTSRQLPMPTTRDLLSSSEVTYVKNPFGGTFKLNHFYQ